MLTRPEHEPEYFRAVKHVSDSDLTSFASRDLESVRVANSAYGLHLFGMTPNFSIYSNTRWQGTFPTWSFVPGTQNSGRPCAVDFPQGGLTTDHLYVFFTAALDGSIGWLRTARLVERHGDPARGGGGTANVGTR